jgi:DNA-binding NarL/FixJ family response regulator
VPQPCGGRGIVTRVLVVDDHPLFREGMRSLLDAVGDIDVIGEAATGDEAVVLSAELQPDVVLMDIGMPGVNGIEATRAVLERCPSARVLMITMFEEPESIFAALRAGAQGYLLKDARPEEMLRAIRAVANGEAIFGPGAAERVRGFFATASASPRPPAPFQDLTVRETEVLALIARGVTNQQISDQFGVSLKTVQNHVANVLAKLHVVDRAQAALRAREAGLG